MSNYTCPHCNLHYCSLPCFRAPQHAGCSEQFDKRTLVDDIQGDKGKSEEERNKMMELLRKFEEDSLAQDEEGEGDDEGGEGGGADPEAAELAEKLRDVDLGKQDRSTDYSLVTMETIAVLTDPMPPRAQTRSRPTRSSRSSRPPSSPPSKTPSPTPQRSPPWSTRSSTPTCRGGRCLTRTYRTRCASLRRRRREVTLAPGARSRHSSRPTSFRHCARWTASRPRALSWCTTSSPSCECPTRLG